MNMLAELGRRLLMLFRRSQFDRDLEEEMRLHCELREQEQIGAGVAAEEARYAARRRFGNQIVLKEESREMWGWSWLENTLQDVRYGFRMLVKNPGFTTVAVLTLALGIGANTAIFSFVDAVLLKPLPFSHPEQIVQVWETTHGGGRNGISTLNFLDWRNQNTVFTAMAAQTWGSMTLTGAAVPVELRVGRVSASYFNVFRAEPLLGRTFAPDEDQPGKQHEVVLSHRMWESHFGADPGIFGRSIQLNGEGYTVIGVMPSGTFDREWQDVWTPFAFERKEMTRDYHWMISWARLKPGVTLEQARQQMKTIAARIEHDYPKSNKGWSATVDRYVDRFVDDSLRKSLLVLLAAVGAVLLIGCVNLANLLLVRGAGREREVVVRSALGGGRGRLVRQFLTESVLLAGLGGVAGVLMGWGLMLALKAWIPTLLLPAEADVRLDGRVLLFTAAIVIATGVLFGIAPALRNARADIVGSLKEGGRGATSGAGRRQVRNALVVAEIALAFVLLSGAGLLLRSFYQLQQVNPGFDATNVITMRLPMSSEQYPDGPRIINYQEQVMEKIQAVPGVRAAAVTVALPLEGWGDGMAFQIEGQPVVENGPTCGFKRVSPSYLSALGLRLLKGRWLAETDGPGTLPVAVINETMARRTFKGEDPIGKRILIQQIILGQPALGPEIPWEVVGVIAEEKMWSLDDSSRGLYVSYKQSPTPHTALVVRGAMDPTRLVKSIQSAVWQLNKDQAFDDIKTLEQIKSDSLGENRMRTVLLGAFAGLALVLAAIGIYGVISYSVAQRTHEMGVRAALGASRWDQFRLVLKSGMTLTAIGMAIGIAGALGLTRLLSGLLFGVSPHDPWTLAFVSVLLAAVAGTACFIPARRATKVDPMVALRYE
jgi:putative ABC transport system permease protein